MTFEELIADLLETADDRHPGVESFLRTATVRALGPPISRLRAEWTETSTTFTTIADTAEYDNAVTSDFPVNVGDIDLLRIAPSSNPREILTPVGLAEVRSLGYLSSQTPRAYHWRARKLILGPPTVAGLTIAMDYTIDARRDETSGDLITSTDTTTTNAWFRPGEGHDLLRCRVLTDYYASYARNPDLASVFSGMFEAARREMRSQVQAKRDDGVVAPGHWPGDALWTAERWGS